jgi:hypothetical protein
MLVRQRIHNGIALAVSFKAGERLLNRKDSRIDYIVGNQADLVC